MRKNITLALAALLVSGSALAETPEGLLVKWGYMDDPAREPVQMVHVKPVQPRDDVEASMLAHGLPIPGAVQEVEGSFVVHNVAPRKLDPVTQLLVDWDHIQVPTVSADYVKVAPTERPQI